MKTTFTTWLIANRIEPKTAKRYETISLYFETWAENEGVVGIENPRMSNYEDLLAFVEWCKSKGQKPHTIQQKIGVLCYYFNYHKNPNNPALEVKLKGKTKTIPNAILTQEELDNLYHKFEPFNLGGNRNKSMLGMVIYQGVGSGELERLELEDLDFKKGAIYIKGSRKSNSRTIELKAFQLMDLQNYVMKIRPKILQEAGKETTQLFTSLGAGKSLSNSITLALKRLKEIEPKLQGFQQIRTTVITNWVQDYGLRKAQYLAGHKYVSSTENYQKSDQKDLLNQLDEKHPF